MPDPTPATNGQDETTVELLQRLWRESGSRIPEDHLHTLVGLPMSWRFCGLRGKAPFEQGWNDPSRWYSLRELMGKNSDFAERCYGVGALTGEASGGLLVVDFDEPPNPKLAGAAESRFQELTGHPSSDLPLTAVNISGRPGRCKVFLWVPHAWWPLLRGHSLHLKVLDLLWEAGTGVPKQAVIAGDHPDGQGWYYRWDLPPADVGVAIAPEWLLTAFAAEIVKEAAQASAATATAAAQAAEQGQPRPMDLLSPGQQRTLLRGMSKHWPYRGGKAGTPQAGHYSVISRLVLSLWRGIDDEDTFCSWLEPLKWNKQSDWDGSGGSAAVTGSSLLGLARSLAQSQTAQEVAPWAAAWALAVEGGWKPPAWAIPPREVARGLLDRMAKKKVALLDALQEIEGSDDPTCRELAQYDLAKALDIRKEELTTILLSMEQERRQSLPKFLHELEKVVKPVSPLISGLVGRGALTLLVSEGGAGKTGALYNMAWSVAYGDKFASVFDVEEQGNVLVIQSDESAANMLSKVRKRMGVSDPECRIRWEFSWSRGMMPELRSWIREHDAKLVVMDSLLALLGGGGAKVNDAEIALPIYQLNQIAEEEHVAIVLAHHTNRSRPQKALKRGDRPERLSLGQSFGSSYITNGASDVLGLQRLEYEGAEDGDPSCVPMQLEVMKDRSGIAKRGDCFGVEGSEEDLSLTVVNLNADPKALDTRASVQTRLVRKLERLSEATALPVDELASALSTRPNYIQKALNDLQQSGQVPVSRKKEPGKGRPRYRYWIGV